MRKKQEMNKSVVRKMIKRIGSTPESYHQEAWFIETDRRTPCGTVACLAGEAVICSARTIEDGIKLAFLEHDKIPDLAEKILGLPYGHAVFAADANGWPEPYDSDFAKAKSRKDQAAVAVAYLKEALKRGTMIWETAK